LPLVTRVPSLPELAPGTRVRLEVQTIDLVERSLGSVYRETVASGTPPQEDDATAS
jgi:hypothetical protein